MAGESELDMVKRHVRDGAVQVARQREIVAALGKACRTVAMAESLLALFVSIQDAHLAHLARITADAVDHGDHLQR
jgi:hypothetical protein